MFYIEYESKEMKKQINKPETRAVPRYSQGGKGETPGVSTPPYSTITPLEKKYQWSTTGLECSSGGVGSE
jgi:hypothetical protein